MTDEKQTRVTSSAALPHLHTEPWSILTTVGASVLDAALKVAAFSHLNAHGSFEQIESLYNVSLRNYM